MTRIIALFLAGIGISAGLLVEQAAAETAAPASQPAVVVLPEKAELAERIRGLVGDLDGNALRTVMVAYNELMEIGLPAVEELKQATTRGASRQTRVRAACMIPEIIKRSQEEPEPAAVDESRFKWTEPVNGIAARLSCDRDKYYTGQVVRVRLDFENVDKGARPLAPLTAYTGSGGMDGQAECLISTVAAGAAEPAPGKVRPYERRPLTMELAPGQMLTYRFRLNEAMGFQASIMAMHDIDNNRNAGLTLPRVVNLREGPLKAGDYEFRVRYFAQTRGLLEGAASDLCATLPIKVIDRPASGPASKSAVEK